MKMAKIGLPKGSGKRLKVREKSVRSQGILKRILSGNPVNVFFDSSIRMILLLLDDLSLYNVQQVGTCFMSTTWSKGLP